MKKFALTASLILALAVPNLDAVAASKKKTGRDAYTAGERAKIYARVLAGCRKKYGNLARVTVNYKKQKAYCWI